MAVNLCWKPDESHSTIRLVFYFTQIRRHTRYKLWLTEWVRQIKVYLKIGEYFRGSLLKKQNPPRLCNYFIGERSGGSGGGGGLARDCSTYTHRARILGVLKLCNVLLCKIYIATLTISTTNIYAIFQISICQSVDNRGVFRRLFKTDSIHHVCVGPQRC